MKYTSVLAEGRDGRLRMKTPGGRTAVVCRVGEAGRRLKRTRRQVYRYIREGVLVPRGKMLGEWLLDVAEVERLACSPLAVWPIPARLQPFFPEYDVSKLNAGRDKTLVISRLLESGARGELRWLSRRYPQAEIALVVEKDGLRLLSSRALRFWSLYFNVRPRPSWRSAGNPWLSRNQG